jgi:formamidopyrimidine-DNA glycosylase
MPELPEVAYQKKYADATILHKKIIKVETGDNKLYHSSKLQFQKTLKHNQFTSSERLGKYLFLNLEKNGVIVIHFGMTGKLEYYLHEEVPMYAQLTITFDDYSKVSFVCPRKLGKLYLAQSLNEFKIEHNIGIDALSVKNKKFHEILKNRWIFRIKLRQSFRSHCASNFGSICATLARV